MIARGISKDQVNEAIRRGSKRIQKSDKIISDYKYYSVVFKKEKDACFVITVMPRWRT